MSLFHYKNTPSCSHYKDITTEARFLMKKLKLQTKNIKKEMSEKL